MPFVDLPERRLRVYYVINPHWPYSSPSELKFGVVPECKPLDPTKECLFLMHPSSSSSAVFSEQFGDPRFQNFNMIAVDARHAGWTTGEKIENYSLEEAADDIIAAIDQLDIPTYSVLGEGFFGANVVAWIAIKRPEKVRALILVSPGWPEELDPDGMFKEMHSRFIVPALSNKGGKGDGSGRIPQECLEICAEYFFAKHDRNFERIAGWVTALQSRYGPGHDGHELLTIVNWFLRKAIPEELRAAITVPTLILASDEDQTYPLESARAWQASFTGVPGGADMQIIKSAPHLILFTSSSVANRIVLSFLKRFLQPELEATRFPERPKSLLEIFPPAVPPKSRTFA
ncbi:alpha/beta-hydrolase [Meredithblackwellia eburnea MCA 4105]